MNKKIKVLARKSVLSSRVAENNLTIVEDFTFAAPKTKSYLGFLGALSLSGAKTLLITGDYDSNVYLSARNIPKTKVLSVDEVSTYDLINADKVLLSEGAVSKIESILN